MEASNRTAFRLRACQSCGGDAYLDIWDTPEWHCLQCGRPVVDETARLEPLRPLSIGSPQRLRIAGVGGN